jgi:hypothetical protein
VPGSGRARQKNDLLPNGAFNPIGNSSGCSVLKIAPDFNEIERGFRRQNIAPHLIGLRFLFRQVGVQLVFRYALATVELRDATPNFRVDCVSIFHEPPILRFLRFEEMQ